MQKTKQQTTNNKQRTKTFIKVGIFAILLSVVFAVLPAQAQNIRGGSGQGSSEFCRLIKDKTLGAIKCGSETEGLSFTEFRGGLRAPSTEGLDPSLTQSGDLRTFVIRIVQFVLGFLGLVAMIVIIYAGFLYVTSAGEEDNTNKAKNAIKYAVFGIVIIMVSFALVNTLLRAPTGTDRAPGEVSGIPGVQGQIEGSNQERQVTFNKAIAELDVIGQSIISNYEKFLKALEIQEVIQKRQYTTDVNLAADSIQNFKRSLEDLSPHVDPLGQTSEYIRTLNGTILQWQEAEAKGSLDKWRGPEGEDFATHIIQRIANKLFDAMINDYKATIAQSQKAIEEARTTILPKGKNEPGITGQIAKELDTLSSTDLGGILDDITKTAAGPAPKPLQAPPPIQFTLNSKIVQVISKIARIQEIIKETKFVSVSINASTVAGNAPLFVSLDGLKAADPSSKSLDREKYEWNLAGASQCEETGVSSVSAAGPTNATPAKRLARTKCTGLKGATVSALFNDAGRYRIELTVNSNEPNKYAAGRAFIDIVVSPPAATIVLSENGNPDVNLAKVSTYQVDLSEAKSGIQFNAQQSKGKDGSAITEYIWNFGDGTPEVVQSVADPLNPAGEGQSPSHQYKEPGAYDLTLTLKDQLGNTDRKILKLIVSSPTARIIPSKSEGFAGEEFILDGRRSSADSGQIVDYEWKVFEAHKDGSNGDAVKIPDPKRERITFKPLKPGTYNITLTVTDNNTPGRKNTSPVTKIYVNSRTPEAFFEAKNPNKFNPGLYVFDASKSFDPDENDKLYYEFIGTGFEVLPNQNLKRDNEKGYESPIIKVKFKEKGKQPITLIVTDQHGEIATTTQEVNVESILDVDFTTSDNAFGKNLNSKSEATFGFKAVSENAVAYEWSFGDPSASISADQINKKETEYTYTVAGIFNVTLTVFDDENNENSITKKVYVGNGKGPIAILDVRINGEEIGDLKDGEVLKISRQDTIQFDARRSLGADGKPAGRRFRYSWNLGRKENDVFKSPFIEGVRFEELSEPGKPFEVTLQVSPFVPGAAQPDLVNDALSKRTLKVTVVPLFPKITGIELVPLGKKLVTPLEVQLKAVQPQDPDGKVLSYRWWYYDTKNSTKELDSQISTVPTTRMVINTNGEEGEQHTYKFGVEVTDNENNTVSSNEILSEKRLPAVTVKNGPNKPPVAKFTVNKTNVLVGETVNFVSTSEDPDGEIIKYIWDFEGNGFFDNKETKESNVGFTFKKKKEGGYPARVKVFDNNGASAVSEPLKIFVDTISEPPEAAFAYTSSGQKKITFVNNSTTDKKNNVNLEKVIWDFNIVEDTDGNGNPEDDNEKPNADPGTSRFEYEYPDFGIYRAKLTVVDSNGNQDSVTRFVKVERNATQQNIPEAQRLEARLISNPAPQVKDGRIHLQGDTANVTFEYKTSLGDIQKFVIDKNIYFDGNGNGIPNDDEDHIATKAEVASNKKGVWTTNFERAWGRIAVRLAVFDNNGNRSTVDKEIIFDPKPTPTPSASAVPAALKPFASVMSVPFTDTNVELTMLNTALVLVAAFGIIGLGIFLYDPKRKK